MALPCKFIDHIVNDKLALKTIQFLMRYVSTSDVYSGLEMVRCALCQRPDIFNGYSAKIMWAYDPSQPIADYNDQMEVVICRTTERDFKWVYHVATGKDILISQLITHMETRRSFTYSIRDTYGFSDSCDDAKKIFDEHSRKYREGAEIEMSPCDTDGSQQSQYSGRLKYLKEIVMRNTGVREAFGLFKDLAQRNDTDKLCVLDMIEAFMEQYPERFSDYAVVFLWAYNIETAIYDIDAHIELCIIDDTSEVIDSVYHVASRELLTLQEAVAHIRSRDPFPLDFGFRKGFNNELKPILDKFHKHNLKFIIPTPNNDRDGTSSTSFFQTQQ